MKKIRVSTRSVERHYEALCRDIGGRYAGSTGERRAADYIAGKLSRVGAKVEVQEFDFVNWIPRRTKASLIKQGKERSISEVGAFTYSLPTPAEGIEGELVYIESSDPRCLSRRRLKGKIGLAIGSLDVSDSEIAKRFMDSGLAGLMFVDNRIPFGWRAPIGMAPQWLNDFQMSVVSLPFLKAIELEKEIPARVRLEIDCRTFADKSQNVIGEIPGAKYPDEIIIVSGHIDCVWGNVGADDNASGCIFTMELARALAKLKPARTIRFNCYGVEERLSVGSYLYMRSIEKTEARKVVFCLNADTIASRIGKNVALATGAPELTGYLGARFEELGLVSDVRPGVSPYSDQFPFNICGVPSVWLTRLNTFDASHWTLHSRHDSLENVSAKLLADTASVYATILAELASMKTLPFPRSIPAGQRRAIRESAATSYRHPWTPDLNI
ncbi:MAG: Iap family predicted aminopeptidase [Limisphaerales bacterium]|jgi:Iap family predicted aminopeptidase